MNRPHLAATFLRDIPRWSITRFAAACRWWGTDVRGRSVLATAIGKLPAIIRDLGESRSDGENRSAADR